MNYIFRDFFFRFIVILNKFSESLQKRRCRQLNSLQHFPSQLFTKIIIVITIHITDEVKFN